MRIFRLYLRNFAVMFFLVLIAVPINAATVAYWRMDNSIMSEYNSPAMDLSVGGTGFSADVPGSYIKDGVSGTSVANLASYTRTNATGTVVNNHTILNDTVSTGSFTIEAFIKVPTINAAYDMFFGKGAGWLFGLDSDASGPALRFYAKDADGVGRMTTAAISPGWHHVAAVGTYVDLTGAGLRDQVTVDLYVDHVWSGNAGTVLQAAAGSGDPGVVGPTIQTNTTEDYYVGGPANPWDGLIDELRVTDTALNTSQFLIAADVFELITPDNCQEVWDMGYGLAADINHDCWVDLKDMALFFEKWLLCNRPLDSDCDAVWW